MEQFVADEVEDKAVFSLHRVAEEFSTGKSYAEVRVVSDRNWKVINSSLIVLHGELAVAIS